MPKFKHLDYAFQIDDEWWREAGMDGFVPGRPSYTCSDSQELGFATKPRPVLYLALATIKPVERSLSRGLFSDEEG